MRPIILIAAAALLLTGCTATTAPQAAAPTAEPAVECVTISDGVAAALEAGLKPDITLTSYAAAPSPTTDGLWYVAATYTTAGSEGEAVWITQQNPTGTDAAFLSVDAVAEQISTYHRLEGGSITAPGATEATACLS